MIYGCLKSEITGLQKKYERIVRLPQQFQYKMPPVLDQGNQPICVPCAISAFLNWNINLQDGNSERDNHINLMEIFKGGGGNVNGMQIKKALEYLKQRKDIKDYALIGSSLALKSAILMNGPCIGGMVVRDNSRQQFWEGSGALGGHAVAIIGWNKDSFAIRNSWGRAFGQYVMLDDFKQFTELWTVVE